MNLGQWKRQSPLMRKRIVIKHEKYLWYARAGHYLNAENPEALLAERIEALISTENAKWISDKEQAGKAKPTTVQQ